MSSVFENRLAEAARAGRAAGENAADSGRDIVTLRELEPEDVEWTDVEIMLHITGEKNLDDPEEEEAILGVFKDNFYDAIEEATS